MNKNAPSERATVCCHAWTARQHLRQAHSLSSEVAQRELAADEEQLFDRDRTQSFIVDECESDLDAEDDGNEDRA